MSVTPGLQAYEVVLNNKHYLRELVEKITLEDSLDEIAYRGNVQLVVTPDFPGIQMGQPIRVSGIPFGGTKMAYLLHPAVVWETDSRTKGLKHLPVSIYDPLIYLKESEDEYLFPAGQTATQRIKKYAADWQIPVANIPNTGVQLAKAVYRVQGIYSMLLADLKETAQKGGKMYIPRMTYQGLTLFEIGTNSTVWVLESAANIEELGQKRTLSGAVTQVKVLGASSEDKRSPVLTIEKKDTTKYGTIQKVIQDSKITSAASGKKAAQQMLSGPVETFTYDGLDINTIRAGDKVMVNKTHELIVISVSHDLGSPGHMNMEMASVDQVRRRFFSE